MTESSVVAASGVSVAFGKAGGQVAALDRVSFELRAQEFLSILGPSGCGKSTLLYAIAGLVPAAGEIRVFGAPLRGACTDVGIVFQRDNLLEWRTVLDNVMLPVMIKRLPDQRHRNYAMSLLERVGLAGFEYAYPHQLSGGMRQRAALCRALVCDVRLLLMDEPFGALDALSREEHQLLLQDIWLADRKTVLFVTHDIQEAVLLSDRIAIMTARPGRIAEIINVDLPRPRDPEMATTPEFGALVKRIRAHLFSRRSAPAKVLTRAAT